MASRREVVFYEVGPVRAVQSSQRRINDRRQSAAGRLHQAFKAYAKPDVLVLDELGYLPIDKVGADLLFQIIAQRYERGSLIITTNRAYKHWAEIFNHDATLTSAILDRLLHHAETVVIEGKSFRMKDRIDD